MGNTNVGMANCAKNGYELIELEESVRYDHGTWIRFMKTPAAAPEVDAKGKPPAKGKGAVATEELKAVYGKGWVSFDDLNRPGCTTIVQRVFLQTCPPMTKKTKEDGTEEEVEDTEYEKVFEDAKSYVHIKIALDQPIIAPGSDKPEPQPSEIVPVKQFVTWPYSKDPRDDFGKQVTLAVESLTKEFFTSFKKPLADLQSKSPPLTETEISERFEEMKKEFFYEVNTQGKYHILKEKMKKSVVRIVKEHFEKTERSIKGCHQDQRDHFYSELYTFLVEEMRRTVRGLVRRKRDELHANIIIPKEQAEIETEHVIEKNLGETTIQRYRRLCNE